MKLVKLLTLILPVIIVISGCSGNKNEGGFSSVYNGKPTKIVFIDKPNNDKPHEISESGDIDNLMNILKEGTFEPINKEEIEPHTGGNTYDIVFYENDQKVITLSQDDRIYSSNDAVYQVDKETQEKVSAIYDELVKNS